jgi:superfamily II DNA or RNA helicase
VLASGLDFRTNPTSHRAQAVGLRPYQRDAVINLGAAYELGHRRVLFVLSTGGGKTIVFVFIIASAVKRGRRVLILVHRVELIDQVSAALDRAGVPYGIIAPGYREIEAPVQIASIASMARPKRLERWRNRFDRVVVDEAQHARAQTWSTVLSSQPRALVLGVTATPERLDGRGLGEIFDEMIVGPSTAELIDAGWLSPFVVFEPTDRPDLSGARIRAGDYAIEDIRERMGAVVIDAAVAEYQRLCPGVPAIVFAVDVAHSKTVAEAFRVSGIRAAHLDGDTPATDRRNALAGLASGEIKVITNCGLISEGVDVPALGAVLMLRPTTSLALYLQQVGRALRPADGKTRAIVLDFAGNTGRHGLPDEPRAWSLYAKPRRQREKAAASRPCRCGACFALNRLGAHECLECRADLRTRKERAEVEMRLAEARRREQEDMLVLMRPRERILWAGADEGRLRHVARLNGFKARWVYFRLRELRAAEARQ